MAAYYNEFDPKAAAWLRQLIKDGLIADGDVDERSMVDVCASDLEGYTQHHFFAGVGTWSYALRQAGWPDGVPVWTASLPCQPFSQAGQRKGKDDDRHLLPHFMQLLEQFRPVTVFGEQVEAAVKHDWLDDLQANMEAEGYSLGIAVLGAHSVGHAHIRNRIYWVASSVRVADTEGSGEAGVLRDVPSKDEEQQAQEEPREDQAQQLAHGGKHSGVADSLSEGHEGGLQRRQGTERENIHGHSGRDGTDSGSTFGEQKEAGAPSPKPSRPESWLLGRASEYVHPMSGCLLLPCKDGKYRPIKSFSAEMVDGVTRGMVCCCCTSTPFQAGVAYASKNKANTETTLPTVREVTAQEKVSFGSTGPDGFQKEKVLRQGLHVSSLRRCDEGGEPKKFSPPVKEESESLLRGVWERQYVACSSCGRQSFKQLDTKLEDIVLEMPPTGTLKTLFGARGSEYLLLLIMRQTSNEKQPLLETSDTLREVWGSLTDQEKRRVEVGFSERAWVISKGINPLVEQGSIEAEAYSTRIKGYGNAIVAPVAQMFISAFMKSKQEMYDERRNQKNEVGQA